MLWALCTKSFWVCPVVHQIHNELTNSKTHLSFFKGECSVHRNFNSRQLESQLIACKENCSQHIEGFLSVTRSCGQSPNLKTKDYNSVKRVLEQFKQRMKSTSEARGCINITNYIGKILSPWTIENFVKMKYYSSSSWTQIVTKV